MAKHQITINIVNKQTKAEEKRAKLERATGKNDEKSPANKLQDKQAKKSGKSTSEKGNNDIARAAIHITTNTVRTASSLVGSVGDYTVESNKVNALLSRGLEVGSIGVSISKVASGKGGWITLILQVIDYITGAADRAISFQNQQVINAIEAERSSQRLGIVTTTGNRNMKL